MFQGRKVIVAMLVPIFIFNAQICFGNGIEQKLNVEESLKTIHIQSFEESYPQIPKIETPTNIIVSRGGVSRGVRITKEDYKVLLRIVEAECTGGEVEDKANVTQVVLNRVKEEGVYPCTIKDVVFAKNQFSPTFDGRYEKVEITESTIQAVNETLANPTRHECLYFKAIGYNSKWFKTLDFVFKDGMHEYYK